MTNSGTNHTLTMTDDATGKSATFPVLHGTAGAPVVDIRTFSKEFGLFTYDPGYTATGSCKSNITYIDGDEGVLLYRGYPIEQLADNSDYMEVCYLLLFGELPSKEQYDKFVYDVSHHTMVHDQINNFFRGFRRDAHPMSVMCGVVGGLAAFYHDSLDIDDPWHRTVASYRLIAKMPTIAAWAYKYTIGQPFIYPRNDMGYAENFLHMCFATPAEEYKVDPVVAKALDLKMRCLKIGIWNDQHPHFGIPLDFPEGDALLVEQVGGHIDRYDCTDFRAALLDSLLLQQAENGQRQ